MNRLKEVEDIYERAGTQMNKDTLCISIGSSEYELDYARAKLNGLKKALATKTNIDRTTNVTR